MSFVSDIRAYFDTRIKTVDSSLNLIDDALNDEPINIIEAQTGYKMVLGDIESERDGNYYIENIPVTVYIYTRPIRNEVPTFDLLYCKAQDIKDAIINPLFAKNGSNWSDIFATSIIPGAEDTDDKLFNMTLEFTIRRDLVF
jgi:hypothetical protein